MSNSYFTLLATHFGRLEDRLNTLDAATGDGDHGSTMLRGLQAAAKAESGEAGKGFRMVAGGASGSLFGALVGELELVLDADKDLGAALKAASERIMRLGQARPGDKTMLDALIPAAEAAAQANPPAEALDAAALAAESGALATTAMTAKRGRARYVEAGGVGHPDAGARSVAEMLAEMVKFKKERA